MLRNVVILGGGTAGLLMAASLRVKLPEIKVQLVASAALGVIGVGEGSTTDFPNFLHGFLEIPPAEFYRAVKPALKLGIRFDWGPRSHYHYSFSGAMRQQVQPSGLPCGYVAEENIVGADLVTALMEQRRVFLQHPQGPWPDVKQTIGYHIENAELAAFLEGYVKCLGVEILEGDLAEVMMAGETVRALRLQDGRVLEADFLVDASGFRSELIGKHFKTPFISYRDSLICDRAIVGGWQRTFEPILPYTIAETMDAGWAWQIEHPTRINRGYVYCSGFISDEAAEAEFRKKNPKVGPTRVVPFIPGRYARQWKHNVFAVGNAAVFVEPLEATSLLVIAHECRFLVTALKESGGDPTPTVVNCVDRLSGGLWDEIRDFLAVHYRFNQRLDTPFWQHCRREVALKGAESIIEYYEQNGPNYLAESELIKPIQGVFQLEGYWLHLVGMKVPHQRASRATETDRQVWAQHCAANLHRAEQHGMTVAQSLAVMHNPRWQWTPGFYR